MATGLNNVGTSLAGRGKYVQARSAHEEALEIRRVLYQPNHPEIADSLFNLGSVALALGELDSAERLYLDALEVRRKVLGERHHRVGVSLSSLGRVHFERRDYPETISTTEQGLAILDETLGATPERTAQAQVVLGRSLAATGELEQAERSLAAGEEVLAALYPADHAAVVEARRALAEVREQK